jgi:hypothetical protein
MDMFNELEVSSLAKKYRFQYHIINNRILIRSRFDNWLVETDTRSSRPYVLKHQSSNMRSCHYHRQRRFYDLQFLFQSIKRHDDYQLHGKYKNLDNMKKLLKKIKNK